MNWIQRLLEHVTGGSAPQRSQLHEFAIARVHARRTITTTIAFGLELRDSQLEIIEHSALTAIVCGSLAKSLQVFEGDAHILRTAAELHEVGMFAVSPDLLMRPTPLTPAELATVRGQAKVSAEIASTMHHPRVAKLILHQYDDFATLVDRLPKADLLLAGILRVSDTISAVSRPRPYQDPMSIQERARLLESGAGGRFHPLVVQRAITLSDLPDEPVTYAV